MSVLVELSYRNKPMGKIIVSDSGFVFMIDYARPDLGQQDYGYFINTTIPSWDKAQISKETKNET